jgi:hypothetical protein
LGPATFFLVRRDVSARSNRNSSLPGEVLAERCNRHYLSSHLATWISRPVSCARQSASRKMQPKGSCPTHTRTHGTRSVGASHLWPQRETHTCPRSNERNTPTGKALDVHHPLSVGLKRCCFLSHIPSLESRSALAALPTCDQLSLALPRRGQRPSSLLDTFKFQTRASISKHTPAQQPRSRGTSMLQRGRIAAQDRFPTSSVGPQPEPSDPQENARPISSLRLRAHRSRGSILAHKPHIVVRGYPGVGDS